jgi:putative oxidoreductase
MAQASPRLYVPALGRIYERLSPCAETALRIGLGLTLIPHGLQKLFGWLGGAGLARFAQIFEGIGPQAGAGVLTVGWIEPRLRGETHRWVSLRSTHPTGTKKVRTP